MTAENIAVPANYQQWMTYFERLCGSDVSEEDIAALAASSCPGIENIADKFNRRLLDTVNQMLRRTTGHCTRCLNEALEENDFSYIEIILRRCFHEIGNCRFYMNIPFLSKKFKDELDAQVRSETARYRESLIRYLDELTEETGSSDLYDMVYYIRRLDHTYGKL